MVTSYTVTGGSQDKPTEQFSLNFEEIKVKYHRDRRKGHQEGRCGLRLDVEKGVPV